MTNKTYRIFAFVLLAVLTAFLLFHESITQVFGIVVNREGSSHGVFIPFLALYFLYLNLNTIKIIELKTDPRGVALLAAGMFFPIFSVGTFHIQFMAFTLSLGGLVMLLFGTAMFKRTAFPIFFLVTMVPIPETLYEALANYSRTVAFGGSLKIISLLGIPYLREGWLIQLHNALLEVAISCSGIRYMISYFVFGIAYAYVTRESGWKRALIVMLTIPISHVASIGRLTIIFFMTHHFGPFWSEHKPHVFLSWCVFFAILFGLMFLDQYLLNRKGKE